MWLFNLVFRYNAARYKAAFFLSSIFGRQVMTISPSTKKALVHSQQANGAELFYFYFQPEVIAVVPTEKRSKFPLKTDIYTSILL